VWLSFWLDILNTTAGSIKGGKRACMVAVLAVPSVAAAAVVVVVARGVARSRRQRSFRKQQLLRLQLQPQPQQPPPQGLQPQRRPDPLRLIELQTLANLRLQ
jgi:hypothetical protein